MIGDTVGSRFLWNPAMEQGVRSQGNGSMNGAINQDHAWQYDDRGIWSAVHRLLYGLK